MRRIAVIPARGGSKRLPRKNIADFLGKPVIAWTIEAALETRLFGRVVVSTEDDEIADIAAQYGAEIDHRPGELAGDSSRVTEVCAEFLEREASQGRAYDVLCCLYATAPLREASDIAATVGLVDPGWSDFAIAVTSYDLPPHQAMRLEDGGIAVPMWPDLITKRSSDIGRLVVDNGSTYAVCVEAFLRTREFMAPTMKVHVMPRERSQDIDEAVDLELARFFAQKIKREAA